MRFARGALSPGPTEHSRSSRNDSHCPDEQCWYWLFPRMSLFQWPPCALTVVCATRSHRRPRSHGSWVAVPGLPEAGSGFPSLTMCIPCVPKSVFPHLLTSVETAVTGSMKTWRALSCPWLSPPSCPVGGRGNKCCFFVQPPRSCLVGTGLHSPNHDSMTLLTSRCQRRMARALAPGSFRVEICDVWGPLTSCLYGTPRKKEAFGHHGGGAQICRFRGVGIAEAHHPTPAVGSVAPSVIKYQRREEESGRGPEASACGYVGLFPTSSTEPLAQKRGGQGVGRLCLDAARGLEWQKGAEA